MKKALIILPLLILLLAGLDFFLVINPCLKIAKENKQSFEIVFNTGSKSEELVAFAKILKEYYPNIIIEKVVTDENFIDKIIASSDSKQGQIEILKQDLIKKGIVKSSIIIKASPIDIGNIDDFKIFTSQELKKHLSLKFNEYTLITAEKFLISDKTSFSYCTSPKLTFQLIGNLF